MAKPAKSKLIINATNIHYGGGEVLLSYLLKELPPIWQVLLLVDRRMPLNNLDTRIEVLCIEPSLPARIAAERQLAREAIPGDQVLCFGNLPPLFRLDAHVTLFVQNRLLLEGYALSGFPTKVRLRLFFERQWIARRLKNCNNVVVQTTTMARLFAQRFPAGPNPRILPFMQDLGLRPNFIPGGEKPGLPITDFLYVASGEPHKNHLTLLQAWGLLAADGFRPSLTLTVDKYQYAGLVSMIDQATAAQSLRIVNIGVVSHQDILSHYRQARALIYPSRIESFGIPLMEAHQAGLDILAPERDYVRDLLDPVESFDPDSPLSVARAVRRYLGRAEQRYLPITAADFLQVVLASAQPV